MKLSRIFEDKLRETSTQWGIDNFDIINDPENAYLKGCSKTLDTLTPKIAIDFLKWSYSEENPYYLNGDKTFWIPKEGDDIGVMSEDLFEIFKEQYEPYL